VRPTISQAFGKRVRALRVEAGLSQEKLAEKAGMHPTYLSDIERGQRNPTLEVISRLAKALGVRIRELFPD
jgi:transcriptional regulator with XRE-family HTH domain